MQVIFNGDDFGISGGINRGIIDAYSSGLLTSTSVAACGEAVDEGLRMLKDHPGCDVGVHLVLCDERSLLSRSELRSLPFNGRRFASRRVLTAALAAGRIKLSEVKAEWRAQIDRVCASGFSPSHLNSHQFVHLLPGLYPLCLELADEYCIPWIRSTIEDLPGEGVGMLRFFQYIVLKGWISFYVKALRARGREVVTTGFLHAGGMLSPRAVYSAVERLGALKRSVALEVMTHPGYMDAPTVEKYGIWGYRWDSDLALLTNSSFARGLRSRGVRITCFRDL